MNTAGLHINTRQLVRDECKMALTSQKLSHSSVLTSQKLPKIQDIHIWSFPSFKLLINNKINKNSILNKMMYMRWQSNVFSSVWNRRWPGATQIASGSPSFPRHVKRNEPPNRPYARNCVIFRSNFLKCSGGRPPYPLITLIMSSNI